jgi:hypothetical protein
VTHRRIRALAVLFSLTATLCAATGARAAEPLRVPVPIGEGWKVLGLFSRGHNYYTVLDDAGTKLIRATYHPGSSTTVLYSEAPREDHYQKLSWRWRVHSFPQNANELIEGRIDSAAAVYVYFEATLSKYVIKYVWSVALASGTTFRAKDSTPWKKLQYLVREGPPPEKDVWLSESVDLVADFKRCFPEASSMPPVAGIGLLSDGDGTRSEVQADYADFEFLK